MVATQYAKGEEGVLRMQQYAFLRTCTARKAVTGSPKILFSPWISLSFALHESVALDKSPN